MMRSVYLHGALGKEFGRKHLFDVDSITDVICALRANFPRFASAIRDRFYRVILGKNISNGVALGETELGFNLGRNDVHIVPATQGRKRGGLGKIVAGIALIGLSMVPGLNVAMWGGAAGAIAAPTWAGVAGTLGSSMLLTGVASMLAPEIEAGDNSQSFTMTGPVSNMREGGIVPIAYGEVIVGGSMISGGISVNATETPSEERPPVDLSGLSWRSFGGGSAFRPATPGGSTPPEPA